MIHLVSILCLVWDGCEVNFFPKLWSSENAWQDKAAHTKHKHIRYQVEKKFAKDIERRCTQQARGRSRICQELRLDLILSFLSRHWGPMVCQTTVDMVNTQMEALRLGFRRKNSCSSGFGVTEDREVLPRRRTGIRASLTHSKFLTCCSMAPTSQLSDLRPVGCCSWWGTGAQMAQLSQAKRTLGIGPILPEPWGVPI